LRKNPVFSLVAVATLALGIGANTAMLSLLNQVVLQLLPVKDPDQLVIVTESLFVSERHHRIHPCCSSGGNPTCQHTGCQQQQNRARQSHRIVWFHSGPQLYLDSSPQ
jgi:hypothetical protein